MNTIKSKDGTTIAFDESGSGSVVILVAGALQFRAFDQGMKTIQASLAEHFRVINYDRRGRGDSGDTQPFAVEREIEDIEALIDYAGGQAALFGISSGAALAMEATIALPSKVTKLAMYEAPYNDDATARQNWRDYRKQIAADVAAGQPGEAVLHFMMLVGMPEEHVEGMRHSDEFALFAPLGTTLLYDAAVLGEESAIPAAQAARVTVPTLTMDGGASYPFMHDAAVALAQAMPHGQQRTLEGQTHEVDPAVIAPVLIEFFK